MSTLVCFHAHPDDESIITGGTIAKYAAAGHRVVLVFATGGELGETPDDLAPGETLHERRVAETACSAAALGVSEVLWLGYRDSGMTGWDANHHPAAFIGADTEQAAERLAAILREEEAGTLTIYDWHGIYGHPDHIKVHTVGRRAAELAATPYVYEATTNRDTMRRLMDWGRAAGLMEIDVFDPDAPADDGNPFGTPEAEITTTIDIAGHLDAKRASLACHRSQISDTSIFLSMPEEVFAIAMGREWFVRVDRTPNRPETELAGLDS